MQSDASDDGDGAQGQAQQELLWPELEPGAGPIGVDIGGTLAKLVYFRATDPPQLPSYAQRDFEGTRLPLRASQTVLDQHPITSEHRARRGAVAPFAPSPPGGPFRALQRLPRPYAALCRRSKHIAAAAREGKRGRASLAS